MPTPATTFKKSHAEPSSAKDKKKQQAVTSMKKNASAATTSTAVTAPAPSTETSMNISNGSNGSGSSSSPAAVGGTAPSTPPLSPAEPEHHVDGDAVDSAMRKLKGNRPNLLRTSTYYEGAKSVYISLAGLPVLNGIAPTVEAMTESLINMTPLKPSPEEQAEQKSVAVLDKRICDALSYADEVVDVKKDETIEGMVSAKKAINTLGPVQTVVGAACNVGDGVGKAYGSANDTVGHVWHQVLSTVSGTYTGVTTAAGNTANNVASTAGNAVNTVTTTTGNVVNSAKTTAGSTVEGVKSIVGSTTDSIGSNVKWVTTTTMSFIGAAVSYPIGLVQSIIGNKKTEPPPKA